MVYSEGIVSETPDSPKVDTFSINSIIQSADFVMIGVYIIAVSVHKGEGLNQKSWTINILRKRHAEMPNQKKPSLRLFVQFTEICRRGVKNPLAYSINSEGVNQN